MQDEPFVHCHSLIAQTGVPTTRYTCGAPYQQDDSDLYNAPFEPSDNPEFSWDKFAGFKAGDVVYYDTCTPEDTPFNRYFAKSEGDFGRLQPFVVANVGWVRPTGQRPWSAGNLYYFEIYTSLNIFKDGRYTVHKHHKRTKIEGRNESTCSLYCEDQSMHRVPLDGPPTLWLFLQIAGDRHSESFQKRNRILKEQASPNWRPGLWVKASDMREADAIVRYNGHLGREGLLHGLRDRETGGSSLLPRGPDTLTTAPAPRKRQREGLGS